MEPQNLRFGGGAAGTLLHPLVAVELALAIILILCLPRKYAIAPLLLTIFTVPLGQVVVLAGVHFTIARILIITGLVRLATSKRELPTGRFTDGFNSLDQAFILCALAQLIIFSVQWMEMQALIKSLGGFLDTVGGYFVLRFLIQDRGDVRWTIKVLAIIAVVLGACMLNEHFSNQNVFGLLGGVGSTPSQRDGQIRSQGAFALYITAGVFGATLLPLFIWLWSDARSKVAAVFGMVGATVITFTSNSSTPLLAYVAGIVGLCFWPLRKHMRPFRWALVLTLVGLHLAMKAPVWALIARVDLTGSSSGYHRYMLVDNCIRHFSDWWLLGFKGYGAWGWDMWDLCNQYVANALTGGLVTLVLFIMVISRSFGRLGTARNLAEGRPKEEWFVWCIGAALFAHVVALSGVGYWDQIQFAWFTLLAIIPAAVAEATRSSVPHVQEALASSYEADAAVNSDMLETNH
jgi:hypothetical protein